MTDIDVILPEESEYEIKFCRQITNFRIMGDFMQKMHVLELSFLTLLTLGPSPTPNKWLIPLNQYIFKRCIPWLYSSF